MHKEYTVEQDDRHGVLISIREWELESDIGYHIYSGYQETIGL